MKWKILESTYLHRLPWLTVRKDKCQLPNGKLVPAFYVNEYPDWANSFALTKEGEVVMVKQYRHGIADVSIELPGGVIEENENWQDGMRRELLEETGYTFESMEYMGKISPNPSTTNNWVHMFFATGGTKVSEQKLDDTEDVEVQLMSIGEVKALVKENKIAQSLHITTIFYALDRMGEMKY